MKLSERLKKAEANAPRVTPEIGPIKITTMHGPPGSNIGYFVIEFPDRHPERVNQGEKWARVKALLNDPEWSNRDDGEIAEQGNVDKDFVVFARCYLKERERQEATP